jgi:hypothetical protein
MSFGSCPAHSIPIACTRQGGPHRELGLTRFGATRIHHKVTKNTKKDDERFAPE